MEDINQKITKAIHQEIVCLGNSQETGGNFLGFSTPEPENFDGASPTHSSFSTALVLSCLNSMEETPALSLIKRRAASFLLTQKSEHWSYNYWLRNSKEAETTPYPDDLDCTFCTLAALSQYCPELINGEVMAEVVSILTTSEESVGGPYRTWLVAEDSPNVWKDVDLAVNANIAYFLSLKGIELPKLNQLIEESIEQENFTSPYYYGPLPIAYFISRFYRGKNKEKLKDFLLSPKIEELGTKNPLNRALRVVSLINLGMGVRGLEKEVTELLPSSLDVCREPYPFVVESAREKSRRYCGSSALTTAFCLEALSKYLTHLQSISEEKSHTSKKLAGKKEGEVVIREKVAGGVTDRFSRLSDGLKTQAMKSLSQTLKSDSEGKIILTPYYFRCALGENAREISDDLLIKLGMANLYGWLAYTIYDNFLDNEGDPRTLAVANVALRELTNIFTSLLPGTDFTLVFHQIMDGLEEANTWETTHCRLKTENGVLDLGKTVLPDWKNYERLAYRSLGHALGPVAILYRLGYSADSPEVKNVLDFYTHYLIAKQLNDDAHDWEKDLKLGLASPVVTQLLKKSRNRKPIGLSELKPQLQRIFWYEEIEPICQEIFQQVELSRRAIRNLSIVTEPQILEKVLAVPESSAKKALTERQQVLDFLRVYHH